MTSSSATQQKVEQALRQSPIPALRKLRVEETENGVVLSGNVSSYYLKQMAQETVLPVLGPCGLNNQVEVVRNGPLDLSDE